jgi:hypothetical protein
MMYMTWNPFLASYFLSRFRHFKIVTDTSVMIGTQPRHPYRGVQLGETVILKHPVEPC